MRYKNRWLLLVLMLVVGVPALHAQGFKLLFNGIYLAGAKSAKLGS